MHGCHNIYFKLHVHGRIHFYRKPHKLCTPGSEVGKRFGLLSRFKGRHTRLEKTRSPMLTQHLLP